jgi:hypothetical protein
MRLPVVKVNWRWTDEGYIYGVLFDGGRAIVAWDNATEVHYCPIFALPRHERTGEEVEVPDEFIDVAHRYIDSRMALTAWCPEELKQRSLLESRAVVGGD